jgi:hypothetical protein
MLGCTKTEGSPLRTVTLETDAGVKESMRFLIDKIAELCLCKYSVLRKATSPSSKRLAVGKR